MTQQKKQPEVVMGFKNSSSWCKGRDCHSPCVPNVNIKASTFQWAAVQLSPGKQCRAPQRRRHKRRLHFTCRVSTSVQNIRVENYGRASSAPVVTVGVKIKNAIQCPRWLDNACSVADIVHECENGADGNQRQTGSLPTHCYLWRPSCQGWLMKALK